MAYDNPVLVKSFDAGADLSASQFKVLKFDGSGNVVLCGLGENACGVLQNKPASGGAADAMLLGVSRALSGAAFAAGAKLACDASGRLIGAASGQHVVAIAQSAASGANEIVPVLLALGGAPLP
jgi:hypothetical protein